MVFTMALPRLPRCFRGTYIDEEDARGQEHFVGQSADLQPDILVRDSREDDDSRSDELMCLRDRKDYVI